MLYGVLGTRLPPIWHCKPVDPPSCTSAVNILLRLWRLLRWLQETNASSHPPILQCLLCPLQERYQIALTLARKAWRRATVFGATVLCSAVAAWVQKAQTGRRSVGSLAFGFEPSSGDSGRGASSVGKASRPLSWSSTSSTRHNCSPDEASASPPLTPPSRWAALVCNRSRLKHCMEYE